MAGLQQRSQPRALGSTFTTTPPPRALYGRFYHLRFTERRTEAQRREATWLRSFGQSGSRDNGSLLSHRSLGICRRGDRAAPGRDRGKQDGVFTKIILYIKGFVRKITLLTAFGKIGSVKKFPSTMSLFGKLKSGNPT